MVVCFVRHTTEACDASAAVSSIAILRIDDEKPGTSPFPDPASKASGTDAATGAGLNTAGYTSRLERPNRSNASQLGQRSCCPIIQDLAYHNVAQIALANNQEACELVRGTF
jgi:hypothetical protein